MKIKTRTVYYCDFCKKKSFRKSSMEKHEKHCTMNPKRECRLCKLDRMLTPEDCPICEFSRLRISGKLFESKFNFEEEMKKYWEAYNKEQSEAELRSLIY